MPRSYGRFTTSIWRDPDFTSLTLAEQGLYFTLGLQPDVTAAGTLPFTARRWAKLSTGVDRDDIEKLILSLAEHAGSHLVIDEDTEELMIRKFIKWDQGWANAKRLPVVVDAIAGIASERIRHTAVDELHRIATSDVASPEQRDAVSHAITRFDRVVVTEVGNVPNPQPVTLEREPAAPRNDTPAASGDGPPSTFCSRHPNGTEQPCGACATARERRAAWNAAKLDGEVAAKKAAAAVRAACQLCDEHGKRIHPDTKLPVGRCDHQPLTEARS